MGPVFIVVKSCAVGHAQRKKFRIRVISGLFLIRKIGFCRQSLDQLVLTHRTRLINDIRNFTIPWFHHARCAEKI